MQLYMLAILKTLVDTKARNDKIDRVISILTNGFSFPRKIMRIFRMMRPNNFMVTDQFEEKFETAIRNRALIARRVDRMLNRYSTKDKHYFIVLGR